MSIDFDNLYSVCQYSFNELKKCMVEIHSKKQKGTLRYQTPDVIMHKISEMFSNLNKALSDSESFHFEYFVHYLSFRGPEYPSMGYEDTS